MIYTLFWSVSIYTENHIQNSHFVLVSAMRIIMFMFLTQFHDLLNMLKAFVYVFVIVLYHKVFRVLCCRQFSKPSNIYINSMAWEKITYKQTYRKCVLLRYYTIDWLCATLVYMFIMFLFFCISRKKCQRTVFFVMWQHKNLFIPFHIQHHKMYCTRNKEILYIAHKIWYIWLYLYYKY